MALINNTTYAEVEEETIEGIISNIKGYTGKPAGYSHEGIIGPIPGSDAFTSIDIEGDLIVKTLGIRGILPLEKGDEIRAYVKVAVAEDVKGNFEDVFDEKLKPTGVKLKLALPVPKGAYKTLEEKMNTYKIEKIRDGGVVATYTAHV